MSADFSFPQSRRLQSDKTIQSVFDSGDFFKGEYSHLIRGSREAETDTRAVFMVSEKTASKSTERNRIRRLMRESFRLKLNNLEEGWPLIFLATRKAHGELERQDLDRNFERLLEKAQLISSKSTEELN